MYRKDKKLYIAKLNCLKVSKGKTQCKKNQSLEPIQKKAIRVKKNCWLTRTALCYIKRR